MVVYSFLVVPRSKSKETASVVRVVDGDTVDLEIGERVRLIGIDAPEMWMDPPTASQRQLSRSDGQAQSGRTGCFAEEAKNKLKELVEGKVARLEKDKSERDKYDRLLRYVFVDDNNIGEIMVREGFARLATYPPDTKYYGVFKEAEKKARENKLGLWGMCPN